jgi:hypothetical protein
MHAAVFIVAGFAGLGLGTFLIVSDCRAVKP